MGVSVREKIKGSGVWWVFVRHKGKRWSKKIGPKPLAKKLSEQIQAKLILGEYNDQKKAEPLNYYIQEWLNEYILILRHQSTYERYNGLYLKYIKANIGQKIITDLTSADVKKLLLQIFRQKSKKTAELSLTILRGGIQQAIDAQVIKHDPTTGVLKALRLTEPAKNINPFTKSETAHILSIAQKIYPFKKYCFFLCAFRTGMRLGELIALEWRDLSFNGRYIKVQRSYRRTLRESTKTGKIRYVDMSEQLYTALKQLQQESQDEIIFSHNSTYWAQNSVRNTWRQLLKKAEIDYRKFHAIRHTYATLLIQANVSLGYIKNQLGHHSIRITVDTYGHWIPDDNRASINVLDKTDL